jgi:hypothetical protein
LNAEVWTTRPVDVQWWSNVSPCTLTGGSTSLSNLPATGTTTVTEATPGTYDYTLTCGTGFNVATGHGTAVFVTPAVLIYANATDRRLGSAFSLTLTAYADSCTPTGGAPNDGWATAQLVGAQNHAGFLPVVTTAGTFTYGAVCSSGPLSASGFVTVTFENDPPYAMLTADKTTVTNVDSFTLTWKSNVDDCIGGDNQPLEGGNTWGGSPQGSAVEYPPNAGTYTLSLSCDGANATPVVITVTDVAPTATLSAQPASITLGDSTTLTWSSTHAEGCTAGGDLWAGMLGASGTQTVTPADAGSYTVTVTCGRANGESADAKATITVSAPSSQKAPPPASGGGGGGGGALEVDSLEVLATLLLWRQMRSRRSGTTSRSALQ